MDNSIEDLPEIYKNLKTINSSLEERLDGYSSIIRSRDNEIAILQAKLASAAEERSKQDSSLNELHELELYVTGLQNQPGKLEVNTSQQQLGLAVSMAQRVKDIHQHCTGLQTQLQNLQMESLELNRRNLIVQSQASRIAELESILARGEISTV